MLLRAAGILFFSSSASTALRSICGFRSAYDGVAVRSEKCVQEVRPSKGDCLALSVPSEPALSGWSLYSTGSQIFRV